MVDNIFLEMVLDPLSGRAEWVKGVTDEAKKNKTFYWVGEFGIFPTLAYSFAGFLCAVDIHSNIFGIPY